MAGYDVGAPPAEFGLLGELQVLRDGRPLALGGRRQRAILAVLMLDAGRPVPLDRLIDLVWGEDPPPGAAGTAQAYVSRLRRLIEPDRAPGEPYRVLGSAGGGYVLDVRPADLDAGRFLDLAGRGRAHLEAGRPHEALELLDAGLRLWRGSALGDLADEPFARAETARLEERRLSAIEDRLDAALALGRHDESIADLRRLVDLHPLRERLAGQLLLALFRAGRQAEALRAYQDVRVRLAEELGVDPGPALRRLESAILNHDPALEWRPRPTPGAAGAGRTVLAFALDGLTGLWAQHPQEASGVLARHHEILSDVIARHRGVMLPGGSAGGTALAVFASCADAIRSVIDLHADLPERLTWAPPRLGVRIGLHTGEDDVRAQRLAEVVSPGAVLLSAAAAALAAGALPEGVSLRELGPGRLRDGEHPEPVFQLLHASLAEATVPLPGGRGPVAVPVPLARLIGRTAELTKVRSLVDKERLVTLVGAGGVGKTRLALEVAAEIAARDPGGACFVDLTSVSDPDLLAAVAAETLRVPEDAGDSAVERLIDHLATSDLLLVLDNCEHLIGACAHLVERLLSACPRLRILATSREPLRTPGETAWRVPSLPLPPAGEGAPEALAAYDSVQLFLVRAACDDDPDPEDLRDVAAICTRLDGIPLAIELAAARTTVLSASQLLSRLDDRFALLAGGTRTALARHQTLRAAIDWSYDLLTEPEQALLRRLAVFAGSFTLEAAEALGEGAVLDLLGQLAAKSLLTVEPARSGTRYRLAETIRQYALEKLVAHGEAEDARARHRDFFEGIALAAQHDIFASADGGPALNRLEADHDNFRAALAGSLESPAAVAQGLRIAHELYAFWVVRGHRREGRDWMAALLERATRDPAGHEALASAVARRAGVLAWESGDASEAERLYREALSLARHAGDLRHEARALVSLGNLARRRARLDEAVERLEASLAMARSVDDPGFVAESLLYLGWVAHHRGHYAEARRRVEECGVARAGSWWQWIGCLQLSARVAFEERRYADAAAELEEAAELGLSMQGAGFDAEVQRELGEVAYALGRPDAAGAAWERALTQAEGSAQLFLVGPRGGLGELAAARGDFTGAVDLAVTDLQAARRQGNVFELAGALNRAGRVYQAAKEPADAWAAHAEALELGQSAGMPWPAAEARTGLALLAEAGFTCQE